MTELIVLGTIPGTSIQITFLFWAMISGAVVMLAIYALYRRHRFSVYRWIAGYIMAFVLTHSAMRQRQTA